MPVPLSGIAFFVHFYQQISSNTPRFSPKKFVKKFDKSLVFLYDVHN